MRVSEITTYLEELAPVPLQESYDNSGLLVGSPALEVSGVLIALDMTEEVLQEAIERKCNLIITHHPVIFNGLKKLTEQSSTERIIAAAIRKHIAIYAIHTNLDNVHQGVNRILSEKIGLTDLRILSPKEDLLSKLVTFCPTAKADEIREALFEAGAGQIGNYNSCSFNLEGTGSFRGSEDSNPYVGEKGKLHFEKETRIEVIFPRFREGKVIHALLTAHPYEEVAYDIYPLSNKMPLVGAGMLGTLPKAMDELQLLNHIKKVTGTGCIRHSPLTGRRVKKVAVCGGSGSFLITRAMKEKVDVFLTGDIKYHDFFLPDGKMLLADMGHHESEQFVKELIYSVLNKKIPNFAVLISKANTNTVNYL
jgi:dinuclear metal center YbgI/SA1388 family protein